MTRPPEPPPVFLTFLIGMTVVAVLLGVPGFHPGVRVAGAVLVVAGGRLHHRAWRLFARRGTTVATLATPRDLVTDDVFARTRNPMYLGGVLMLIGWALALGHPVLLLAPPLFGALAVRWWIAPEERLLAERYGAAWTGWATKVRRWI